MGKLIKYELKKQRTSRMVILVMLLFAILAFTWGLLFNSPTIAGICTALLFGGSFLVLLYTGIESILILNRDLKTRQSYMLWMLPKSVWEILGAKFISAFLQMLFVFALFLTAGCIGLGISIVEIGGIRAIAEAVTELMKNGMQLAISRIDFIMFAAYLFVAWMGIIFTGFLAVILARTFLTQSRFAGLAATVLFFVFTFLIERGYNLFQQIPGIRGMDLPGGWSIWDIVYYVLISLILFGVSGWLADRKLSV